MLHINRQIKSTSEIKKIKKACELGDKVYSQIVKQIQIGVTEKELASKIVKLIRLERASLSFRPIVAFGKNASEVHHKPTEAKLKKNHGFVMIDMGVKLNGYCSDMTRTLLMGKANKRRRKVYQTVLEAQKKSIDYITSSTKNGKPIYAKMIDEVARDYIIKKGFLNIPHSVGHGIGKKVHEAPRISPKSKTGMKDGMVFTIEPGIYIPGFGGVRIEDVVCYTKAGIQKLTKSSSSLLEL